MGEKWFEKCGSNASQIGAAIDWMMRVVVSGAWSRSSWLNSLCWSRRVSPRLSVYISTIQHFQLIAGNVCRNNSRLLSSVFIFCILLEFHLIFNINLCQRWLCHWGFLKSTKRPLKVSQRSKRNAKQTRDGKAIKMQLKTHT